METSSTDDQSTTTETISTTTPLAVDPVLSRGVGSGSSMVLDPEAEAQSRKLPSSRFKGVVPQPNGRWGAQIYEKHQRVWLGTFNEEDEAAKAYDVAVRRFRGGDAVTNLKPATETDTKEACFLSRHSKAEIVDMLRKHTYNDELEQSKRNSSIDKSISRSGLNSSCSSGSGYSVIPREHLFQKTVTPSDVGKLNRLVIPKQHAEKHFPAQKGSTSKGVLLHFEDIKDSKVWRFRYSYWNSSQSYVLTKGWSRFVKEKNLKAGDYVSFQRSTGPEKQLYIDWKTKTGSDLIQPVKPVQMLRLFGVNIQSSVIVNCNGKRSEREMDVLGFEGCKKQRIINVL